MFVLKSGEMKKILTAWLMMITVASVAQTSISGKVKDAKGRPVSGASIVLKDTYDGGTSDSTGAYRFTSSEKGEMILQISSIGFKTWEQKINLNGATLELNIILKEDPSELKAVVITAGSFEASDAKRATVLKPLDIVTTASANADITAAIKTLPGSQQVGEAEGLFVRGGTAQETQIFIDGTLVNNFFYSSIPNIATRGRFSPFLFKGTVFSAGGYSALYGQGLSSALILESIDLPDKSSASISAMTVGVAAGYQELAKNKKSSWGVNYSYTNLWAYFKMVKQQPDYFTIPQFHNLELNYRAKTSKYGMLKFYTYLNTGNLGLRRPDIDSIAAFKDAFGLKNVNWYNNVSWKERLSDNWRINIGASYSTNTDKILNELQDQSNIKQQLANYPFNGKNFDLRAEQQLSQLKVVLERKLGGLSAIRFGGEYLYSRDKSDFSSDFVSHAKNGFDEHYKAGFAEADIYITNDLAAKAGGRFEHSSILNKANFAPRFSLAQKLGKGQASLAYGIFYQKPDRQYLFFERNLQYQKATHYILNYQIVSSKYTLRAEVFYKKYNDLLKTLPDTSSSGSGYAQGFEVFWRDRKTLKNVDYWISYSYLDTKRDYLNYPGKIHPNFAANHTANIVFKKFITNWKTQFNVNYTFATGRPYYQFRYNNSTGKNEIGDQGKTIPYNSASFSMNYLPNIGKKTNTFVVWVLSVTNVFNQDQIFGYQYSYNGLVKQAIRPPAKQFFFLGCFISFGIDRTDDAINSNL